VTEYAVVRSRAFPGLFAITAQFGSDLLLEQARLEGDHSRSADTNRSPENGRQEHKERRLPHVALSLIDTLEDPFRIGIGCLFVTLFSHVLMSTSLANYFGVYKFKETRKQI
jgi:hypothetical protein